MVYSSLLLEWAVNDCENEIDDDTVVKKKTDFGDDLETTDDVT